MNIKLFDSLVNLVSGLGTAKDKTTFNRYSARQLDAAELENGYRYSWLPRKIVDIPAKDATREWRKWQAEADQITLIEELERAMGLQLKVRNALIKGRLYGGGAIVIGVDGAGDFKEELRLDRVKRGSLKFLHVLDRYELSAGELERDITSPNFGMPKFYRVGASEAEGMTEVHHSRVCRFLGAPRPSDRNENDGWGDSILQSVNDAVMDAMTGPRASSILLQEANTDVIKMPNFMQSIGSKEYEAKVLERFRLAQIGQSLVRAKILDSEEEWNRVSASFAGIPETSRMLLEVASGAADIPLTRLLNVSPGGLNATGDSDLENYFNNVSDQQENEIRPSTVNLDEVLIRSALGVRPEEIHYTWEPLWLPKPAEIADIRLKNSQTVVNYYSTGLVPDEALSKGAQNMLIEDGMLPGLEQAIEDANQTDDIDESDVNVQNQMAESSANREDDTQL